MTTPAVGGPHKYARATSPANMVFMMLRKLGILLLACLVIGCGTKPQTFDVAVRNDTDQPLTVWLTKKGDAPREPQWYSPEDVAIAGVGEDGRVPGIVVQPGKARGAKLEGKFPGNSRAVLRVYVGALTLDDMLTRHDPDGVRRIDVPLTAGLNHLIITESEGKLAAERSERFKPATAPVK